MRDFGYKMQQMKDFSCKNQGREPGRPKKKMPKKKANLISRPGNFRVLVFVPHNFVWGSCF